ncbi:hypothetical protein [uncultured Roseibium sp.]|uniref:hypothetical protein n=1 Tax=uncultured Roseibium sp. TaxID=1936171 RepID=UPI00260BFCC5|nr:hypothetical protein [uncultured Roseibium sp.]
MPENDSADRSTEGMVDYNANSLVQKQHAMGNHERIEDLAGRVMHLPGPLNLTDYGCGPGQSTIETARPALTTWLAANASRPISICFADQPGNDWDALMALVTGETGLAQGGTLPRIETPVGSFYDRMVADSSVSLATCFFASHWLSASRPYEAPNTVWFADLTGEARRKMWQAAESDWTRFLLMRAQELQSGGYLFVSTLGAIPETGEINDTAASGRGVYRALQIVTASMVDDGLLDRKRAKCFVFGLWFMTETEARRPFETNADLQDAYEIDTIAVLPVDGGGDLFAAHLDNPVEYARQYTGYTKAFAASSLRKQLFEPTLGAGKDTKWLEDEFFRRFEVLYRENTAAYALEQWHLSVVLKRK